MSAHHETKASSPEVFGLEPYYDGFRGVLSGLDDVWTYTWNDRNEMTGFSEKNASGTVIASGTYTYDALQRRMGVDETSGGTTTQSWIVYNGNSNTPYAQFNGSGSLLDRYLAGPSYVPGVTGMDARTNASGVTDWYLTGKLGSVRDIVNTSGTVIDHISYGAFGSIRTETNPSSGSQFKFDEMQYDTITGLYNDWHRGYSSVNGRFTSQDPLQFKAGDPNLYRFSSNSALTYSDTNGEDVRNADGTIMILPSNQSLYPPFSKFTTQIPSPSDVYNDWYENYRPRGGIPAPETLPPANSPPGQDFKVWQDQWENYRIWRKALFKLEQMANQKLAQEQDQLQTDMIFQMIAQANQQNQEANQDSQFLKNMIQMTNQINRYNYQMAVSYVNHLKQLGFIVGKIPGFSQVGGVHVGAGFGTGFIGSTGFVGNGGHPGGFPKFPFHHFH